MSRPSARIIVRNMRAEVVYQAQRCEYWAGKALEEFDAGHPGAGICLAFVARQRSDAAFAAVADAQLQLRAAGGAA